MASEAGAWHLPLLTLTLNRVETQQGKTCPFLPRQVWNAQQTEINCSRKPSPFKCCMLISRGSWVLTSKATKAPKKGKIVPKMRFSTGQGRGPQAIMAQMLCSNTGFSRKDTLCIWGLDLHRLRSQEGSLQDLLEKEESFGKGRAQVKPEWSRAETSPQSP